jgi:hypothetical protein
MDEKALQKQLIDLFRRLGYDVEADELSSLDADLTLAKDGVRISVEAEAVEQPEAA